MAEVAPNIPEPTTFSSPVDQTQSPLPPLLLQNLTRGDRNTCFANSVIQLLRRVSILKEVIVTINENEKTPENEIPLLLKQIFLYEGSNRIKSTSEFRAKVDSQFTTGHQQDCKEFLDKLLALLPSDFSSPFKFKINPLPHGHISSSRSVK